MYLLGPPFTILRHPPRLSYGLVITHPPCVPGGCRFHLCCIHNIRAPTVVASWLPSHQANETPGNPWESLRLNLRHHSASCIGARGGSRGPWLTQDPKAGTELTDQGGVGATEREASWRPLRPPLSLSGSPLAPYTLHPTPSTLNPESYCFLNPSRFTFYLERYLTRMPSRSTLSGRAGAGSPAAWPLGTLYTRMEGTLSDTRMPANTATAKERAEAAGEGAPRGRGLLSVPMVARPFRVAGTCHRRRADRPCPF